jgi:nicotinate-nucleotide pyrophosphorylase (carboxylating)
MTFERLSRVAATGVDYVSVGALTHSAPSVDLSLMMEGA